MGGKAKFKKHTAKELDDKLKTQRNMGGGKAGTASRLVPRLNFTCTICMSSSPDIKTLEAHYTNKHPKAAFSKDEFIARAEAARAASANTSGNGSHHARK